MAEHGSRTRARVCVGIVLIGRTREAGCGDIAELAPAYPASLCEDRPAL